MNCIGELSKKNQNDFLNNELRKIDQDNIPLLKQKKRVLNIFDSMVTFGLIDNEYLLEELELFCSKSLESQNHFGFKCEVFRFLQRSELEEIKNRIQRNIKPEMFKVYLEVVQNE